MGFARENSVDGPTELRVQPRFVCNGCKDHDEIRKKSLIGNTYQAVCRNTKVVVEPGSGIDFDVRSSYRHIVTHHGIMTNTPSWCPYLKGKKK